MEKFSLNEIAKKFNLMDANGAIRKDRALAYSRMCDILNIVYLEKDVDAKVIPSSQSFYSKYGFKPTNKNTSFADYLKSQGILGHGYSFKNYDLFKEYKDLWEENREECIYEKVDPELIEDIIELISQNEFAEFTVLE